MLKRDKSGSKFACIPLTRYLNNIEHDRSEPRFTTILLFAKALDMDPGELVNAAAVLSWAKLEKELEQQEQQAKDK